MQNKGKAVKAESVFKLVNNTLGRLDFKCTKDDPPYSHYWTCSKEEQQQLYWTMEVWWNQNGYGVEIQDSQRLFEESPEMLEFCRKSVGVELGSGKGHALLSFAIEWKFKEVKGVEFNEKYFQIAQQNIDLAQRWADSHSPPPWMRSSGAMSPISTVQGRAEDFQFEKDVNFIFMFNPFGPKTMAAVCANLIRSLQEYPRDIYICYVNANHRAVFLDSGKFEIYAHHPTEKAKFFILKNTWQGDKNGL